jgi:hypothetical protein
MYLVKIQSWTFKTVLVRIDLAYTISRQVMHKLRQNPPTIWHAITLAADDINKTDLSWFCWRLLRS